MLRRPVDPATKADILPWRKKEDLPRIEHRREPVGGDMQRRGAVSPVKSRRRNATRRKTRKPSRVRESIGDLQQQLDHLKHERDEALDQQAATSEVLKVISRSSFDLKTVFETLVKSASHLCRADKANISLLRGDSIQYVAAVGFSSEHMAYMQSLGLTVSRGSISGRCVVEGRTVHVHDVLADPEFALQEAQKIEGFRTALGVPLLREGTVIGTVFLSRPTVDPFTQKQIELVTTFADQAVIAIENTRLLSELRESLQQQTATADVLKVVSSSLGELNPVFEIMLRNATKLCEASYGTMYLREGDGYRAAARQGHSTSLAEQKWWSGDHFKPRPDVPLARCARTRAAVQVADMRQEPAYLEGEPWMVAGVDAAQLRSIVVVPMLKGDDLLGAIAIYRTEVRPFTNKQVELLTNFAAQAVIAIENTRLLNELRRRTDDLSEALEQQTATSEVLKVISSSPGELEPVFNTMLENAIRLCEASYGNMWLCEGEDFRTAARHGPLPPAYLEKWRSGTLLRLGPEVPLVRAAKTGQPVQVVDLRADQAYFDGDPLVVSGADEAGMRTLVAVPMLKENRPVGVIVIYRKEVRPFTDKQIELVKHFAAQAVIAIENTRLFSELRESLQQQTATADVLKVISRSTFDLQTVLDTLAESAARLCDADQSFLNRREGENYVWAASYGFSQEAVEFRKSRPLVADRGTATGRAIVEGKIVHVPDVFEDTEYTNWEAQKLNRYRAVLGVPLLREGTPMGVFALTRFEPRPFTEKQIELVSIFADQAAIAIENVRLFESVGARTRELAKSLEELRTTQDRLVQTQKLALLGQLTAGIAHEIKNPLNFVNNFSGISAELIDELQDTLKGMPLDDKARADINELTGTLKSNFDKVVHHGRRADAIVKNMLQHSREGSGEHRTIDVNVLVEESLNLAWHGARAETQGFEIKLKQSFDPSAGEADIFPQDIRRALLNVISNGFYAATRRREETNSGD